MPNLLFLSENQPFAEDLESQLKLYLNDFNIFRQKDGEAFFDLILIDEDKEKTKLFSHNSVPVFLLCTNDGEDNEDVAAEIIYKPFSLSVLLDSLRSGIHIFENSKEGFLRFNQYELRPQSKEIYNERNHEITKLTEKEISIIKYLYKSGTRIVSKNELLQEVWGYNPDATTHTIETHIYRLRQKVEQDDASAQLIQTTDGGYQLKF